MHLFKLLMLLAIVGGTPFMPAAFGQCDPQQVAKLLASDGELGDDFGRSVSVSGNTAVVGAWGDTNERGWNAGAAYIFERVGGVWTQKSKLLASDGHGDDWLGRSVSLSGDVVLVGAHHNGYLGFLAGAAYIFERIGGVWVQTGKLRASDGAAGDQFGQSVSVSGDAAIVGALYDDDRGSDSGSVYIFERTGGVWTQKPKLLASDGVAEDWFGISVSVSGNTAFVGAEGDDDRGIYSGSAYAFDLQCNCPSDFNNDGFVNGNDYDAFADAFDNADPAADMNDDGFVNGDDYDLFAEAFDAGC